MSLRFIVAVASMLLLFAAIFPPWREGFLHTYGWSESFVGHRFIFYELFLQSFGRHLYHRVDAGLLLAEVVGIVAVAGLVMVLSRERHAIDKD